MEGNLWRLLLIMRTQARISSIKEKGGTFYAGKQEYNEEAG